MTLAHAVLRLGVLLAIIAALFGVAGASDGSIPVGQVFSALSKVSVVVIGTAGFIAWIDKRIDTRTGQAIAPLREQVSALYNHFLGQSGS